MESDLKTITTEADHTRAMVEVERLWGSMSGTPEGDRLDALVTLIEVYEKKRYPFDPPNLIGTIRFRMEQLDRSDVTEQKRNSSA